MSAAHTPGPWKYSLPDDQVVDLFTPEYFFIEGPGADVHGHMTLADARLIAAAPKLLKALIQMIAWDDGERTEINAIVNAREIVAEAMGVRHER